MGRQSRLFPAVVAAVLALAAFGTSLARAEDDDEGDEPGMERPGMGPGMGGPRMGPPGGGPHGGKDMEPPMLEERFVEKLDEHLKLKEGQRDKIKSLLDGVRPGMKKRMEELKGLQEKMMVLHKEVHASMRDAKEKIRSELDNEQKERFDMMMMRMMHKRGGRKGRGGPGRGGGGPGMGPDGEGMPPWMRERRPGPPGGMGDERDMPPPEMWHEKKPRGGGGQGPDKDD